MAKYPAPIAVDARVKIEPRIEPAFIGPNVRCDQESRWERGDTNESSSRSFGRKGLYFPSDIYMN